MRRAIGEVYVFTFKEGALSAVAHDLRLHFDRFSIELDGQTVNAVFETESLRVDGNVQAGRVESLEHDPQTRSNIERAIRNDVLKTRLSPKATFTGTAEPKGDGFVVTGELDLAGRRNELKFNVEREGESYRAIFELRPSRWGIAKYKAMLGAIRVQDRVRVELSLSEVPD